MILVDYSAIAISDMMIAIKREGEVLTEQFALHMILNSVRRINKKFARDYGRMVICCDGKYNWRKEVFPLYKYKRKKAKEESDIDWKLIYACLESVKEELKNGFPYVVIEHKKAEADDIIGVLARFSTDNEMKTVIVSGDKDFGALHSEFVHQWRPVDESWMNIDDPKMFLKELIIRGDTSDGVPNIKSQDDIFTIEGKRQKSIFKKEVEVWLKEEHFITDDLEEKFPDIKKNYIRNRLLINLSFTPENIKNEILSDFLELRKIPSTPNKGKMTKFFIKNKLRYLHERMDDFC